MSSNISTLPFRPTTPLPLLSGRNYRCQCGQPVFFRNSQCLACGTPLGYDCERATLLPLMPANLQGAEIEDQSTPLWQRWQTGALPLDVDGVKTTEPADNSSASDGTNGLFYKRCLNLSTPAACNWLMGADDLHGMCRACRLNRTIPDLADADHPNNGCLWGRVELAKRRLVSSLITLGLPVASRISEDPERGLVFDFLRSPINGPHVMTGHDTGLITLNVDEADDAKREAARKALREPYRTLLGHFRHEVGHYYWDRLVAGTPWLDGFHQLFGDESTDYLGALKRNYDEGPPADWPLHFVSAYARDPLHNSLRSVVARARAVCSVAFIANSRAIGCKKAPCSPSRSAYHSSARVMQRVPSTHPWEDWAECWAHYLHMRDTVDTALSFGLSVEQLDLEFTPFTIDAVYQPEHAGAGAGQFLAFLNHWTRLTTLLNEMSRSMGQPDFYPFVLPRDVVAKLHFIHLVVTSGSQPPEPTPQVLETANQLQS